MALLLVALGQSSDVSAQGRLGPALASPALDPSPVLSAYPGLDPSRPLRLRPEPGLRSLCRRVLRALAHRFPVQMSVGEPPPSEVPEAIAEGELALIREEAGLRLILVGAPEQRYESRVALSGRIDGRLRAVQVRAVALAIEALRDVAIDGPPTTAVDGAELDFERDGERYRYIYLPSSEGLFGSSPDLVLARPMVFVGVHVAYSPERGEVLAGPRVGLGLCLGDSCLVLEGNFSLLPQERMACDGRRVHYQPQGLGLRLQLRPFHIGDLYPSFNFGVHSNLGITSLPAVGTTRVTTNLGLRPGVELGYRAYGDLEFFTEIGVDIGVSPVRFLREPRRHTELCEQRGLLPGQQESILVEDVVSPWAQLGIRYRPR